MDRLVLNSGQEKICQEAINWYHYSSDPLFQIAAEAGCGKSVLVGEIVYRLGLREDQILPMAFTGQAAIVMRLHGMPTACTCHSGLFEPVQQILKDENGNILYDKQFNTPISKWKFIPRDFTNSGIKLIILDEAWMVPRSFRKEIERTGIKVIATGDPGQLPPIADEPGYLADGKIYYLTELMRQEANSPLVYLAHRARNGLSIESGMYGNDVLVLFDDEIDNRLIAMSNIVLCATNKTRDFINKVVREQILQRYTDFPTYGERIICRKNNWEKSVDGISLVNGLTGTVISPPSMGTFRDGLLTLNFQPDLLSNPFIDVKLNQRYLNADYQEKQALKQDPYLQGDLFEYAYGSTVHLAQGSEYYSGIYIEEDIRADQRNALNYTAITRFRKQMIYVKKRVKRYYSF